MECAFTSPVIIELGMLVMYCMQYVMSVSVVYGVVVFLGVMHMLAMVMFLKCPVCVFRSCISVLYVLMVCGVLMCVNVVSDLTQVMSPPHCLCFLSVCSLCAPCCN